LITQKLQRFSDYLIRIPSTGGDPKVPLVSLERYQLSEKLEERLLSVLTLCSIFGVEISNITQEENYHGLEYCVVMLQDTLNRYPSTYADAALTPLKAYTRSLLLNLLASSEEKDILAAIERLTLKLSEAKE
jgi:hypothetical protein